MISVLSAEFALIFVLAAFWKWAKLVQSATGIVDAWLVDTVWQFARQRQWTTRIVSWQSKYLFLRRYLMLRQPTIF